jgi:hypothetical protein
MTPSIGYFALAPSFESSAAGIVDLDRVRVLVTRTEDSTVALDTIVQIPPEADSLDLNLPVLLNSADETFSLTMQFITPVGDTAFVGGPLTVTATTSGDVTPLPVLLLIEYVGVGFDAADVRITTVDPSIAFGDTLLLQAEALDSSGAVIPNTPVQWTSLDQRLAVPDPGVGRIVGQPLRGWSEVVATLLTGQADTIPVFVEPVPNAVAITSGDAQAAIAGATLAQLLTVSVTAEDGPGVDGVLVVFAAGAGSVAPESVLTDTDGLAQTMWTLGTVAGMQTATAAVEAIPDTVTFSATASAGAPASVAIGPATGTINTIGGTQQFGATANDANGNEVTNATVTWELTDSTVASIDATGLATGIANGVTTVLATAATATGTATLTVSQAATQLAFTVQPSAVAATSPITPAVEISLLDGGGTVATNATDNVTIAIGTNPSGGTISGTLTVSATDGFATFSDLSIDTEGVAYTLVATGTGVTSATSTAFDVSISPSRVIRWTNANGGSWNDPANWSGGAIPTATDSVAIDLAGSYTVALGTAASAENLMLGGAGSTPMLSIGSASTASLTVADGIQNAGAIALAGGFSNATATLTVTDGILVNTGTVSSSSGFGGVSHTIIGTVDNQGTIATDYDLTISNAGGTFNSTSGTLDVSSTRTLSLNVGAVTFGTGTQLTGAGTVSIPTGTLLGLASDFSLAAGDHTLSLGGGGGVTVTGPGALIVADTLALQADTIDAPLTVRNLVTVNQDNVVNGTLAIQPSGALRISSASTASLTVANGFTNAGTIEVNGGFSNATGTLTVASGTLTNAGTISAASGFNGVSLLLDGSVVNQGTVIADYDFTIGNAGDTFNISNGTLSVSSTRTLNLAGDNVFFGSGTVFTGAGTVNIPTGTGLGLTSDFTLAAGDYALSLGGGGAVTVSGPGTFIVADTLGLQDDVIDAPLTVQDLVTVNQTNIVNGALDIEAAGILRIQSASVAALTVANGFTNAGLIDLLGGFTSSSAALTVTSGTLTNTGTINAANGFSGVTLSITADAVNNQGDMIVTYPLSMSGQLIVPAAAPATLTGDGDALTVNGLDVDGLTIGNLPLVSTNGTITRFDNVTFQDMSTAAAQLTVNHPGADTAITFNSVTFLTTPSGGYYVQANDTDTGDGVPLTIDMVGASPPDGSAFESEVNGALINWVVLPGVVWTGAVSQDWNTAGNWDKGRVPGQTDTAYVADATVVVNANAASSVYAIEVTGAASLQLLNGVFTVDSSATVGASAELLLGGAWVWLDEPSAIPGGATVTVLPSGTATLQAGQLSGGAFTNAGTAQLTGAFLLTQAGTLINDGQFEVLDGGSLTDALSFPNVPQFNNTGTLRIAAGSGNAQISRVNLTNTGTVDIQSGTLRMLGESGQPTSFTHQSGALLQGNGTLSIETDASLSFQGDLAPGTPGTVSTFTVNGSLTMEGTSSLLIDVDADGGVADAVVVTGTPGTFVGNGQWTPTLLNSVPTFGASYTIVSVAGTPSFTWTDTDPWSTAVAGNDIVATYGTGGISWTGGGDGTTWHDPANWDNNRVPGTGAFAGLDTVYVSDASVQVAGTEAVQVRAMELTGATPALTVLTSASLTIDSSYSSTGTTNVNGGVFGYDGFGGTVTGTTPTLTLSGGQYAGSGTMEIPVGGSFTWLGGSIQNGNGTIRALGNASIVPSGTTFLQNYTIELGGATLWNSSTTINGFGAVIRVLPGVVVDHQSGGFFNQSSPVSVLDLQGTWQTNVPSAALSLQLFNSGTLEVLGGSLNISNPDTAYTTGGDFFVDSLATLGMGGTQAVTLDATSSVSGRGTFQMSGAPGTPRTLVVNGTYDVRKTWLAYADAIFRVNGSAVTDSLLHFGSEIGGSGLIEIRDGVNWATNETFGPGGGTLRFLPGSEHTFTSGSRTLDDFTLEIGSVLTWDGIATLTAQNASTIRILSGGVIDVVSTGGGTIADGGGAPSAMENLEIFSVQSSAASPLVVDIPFTNSGTIVLGGTNALTFTSTFADQPGAVIDGGGAIAVDGSLVTPIDGNLMPGGSGVANRITFTGQTGSTVQHRGVAYFEIGGVGASDVLEFSDTLDVAGDTVDVSVVLGGYEPAGPGPDSIPIVDAAEILGNPDVILEPTPPAGWSVTVERAAGVRDTLWVIYSPPGAAAVNSWTGSAGDGLWSSAGNWSLGRAPISGDTVSITADGTYTVTLDTDPTIGALTLGGATGAQALATDATPRTIVLQGDGIINQNGVLDITASGLSYLDGAGTLTLDGGTIQASSGAAFYVGGSGDSTVLSYLGGDIAGDGTFGITSSGSLILGTNLTIAAPTAFSLNRAIIDAPLGDTLMIGTGASATISGVSFEQGIINATLMNQGNITFAGVVQQNDSLINAAGATISIRGAVDNVLTVDNGLVNLGTIILDPPSLRSATIAVTNGALQNANAGQLTATADGSGNTIQSRLLNSGTITVDPAAALTVTEAATSHLNMGSITVGSGGTLTITGAGSSFSNVSTGILEGSGTLDLSGLSASVVQGDLLPGGSGVAGPLTITGSTDGTVQHRGVAYFEIGGVGASDLLAISDTLDVAGDTVDVSVVLGGYEPTGPGPDSIPIVDAAEILGDPDLILEPTPPAGWSVAIERVAGERDTLWLIYTPSVAASAEVLPNGITLTDAETQQFDVAALDEVGDTIQSPSVTWASSNPQILAINASGLASGVASGQAVISATVDTVTSYALVNVVTTGVSLADVWARTDTVATGGTPFLGIWGADTTAVDASATDGTQSGASGMWRYDGSAWAQSTGTGGGVSIWGLGPDELYSVAGTSIYRRSGGSWALFATGQWTGNARALWVAAPDDIYVVGDAGLVAHYDGTTWTSGAEPSAGGNALRALWGPHPDTVYAAGDNGSVIRSIGGTWAAVTGTGVGGTGQTAIWGTSPRDVWVAGGGVATHFDGSTWTATSVTASFVGLWGTAPNDVYAAVNSNTQIWHYNGTSWSELVRNIGPGNTSGIWTTSVGPVFASSFQNAAQPPSGYVTRGYRNTAVNVTGSTNTLGVADTVHLNAEATSNGTTVPNVQFIWTSNDEGVATVDINTGIVTAVGAGSANITATAKGGANSTYGITVSGPQPSVSWTGGGDGSSWSDADNWSSAPSLPGLGDEVYIALDGALVNLTTDAQVLALEVTGNGAALIQNANTLTIDSSATFGPNAVYSMGAGTLNGAGSVAIQGTLDWTNGTWTETGTVTVESTGLLALSGSTKNIYTRTLEIAGNATWTGGTIYLYEV